MQDERFSDDATSEPAAPVTVRYWAGARDAAGCAEESVDPGTLAALLERLSDRHGPQLARIIAGSVVLIDGVKVDRSAALGVGGGALVEVLPPFAGG